MPYAMRTVRPVRVDNTCTYALSLFHTHRIHLDADFQEIWDGDRILIRTDTGLEWAPQAVIDAAPEGWPATDTNGEEN